MNYKIKNDRALLRYCRYIIDWKYFELIQLDTDRFYKISSEESDIVKDDLMSI